MLSLCVEGNLKIKTMKTYLSSHMQFPDDTDLGVPLLKKEMIK